MKKHFWLTLPALFQLLISWNFIQSSAGEGSIKNRRQKSTKWPESSEFRFIHECTRYENTEVILNNSCPVNQRENSSDGSDQSSTEQEGDQILETNCWSPTESSLRIIGGVTAGKNKYPYTIGIYVDGYYVCGGSILSSSWVMTAAHCFQLRTEGINVLVRYGQTDSNKDLAIVGVSRFFTHPDFEICPDSLKNDIALVELCQPIDLSFPGVQPICLWTGNTSTLLDKVIATGWGSVNRTVAELQSDLREVTLDVILNSECLERLNETNSLIPGDNDTFFCTYTPGKDACWDDNGGPIIAEVPSGEWVQVGVIGMGLDCSKNDTPRIHTKVSAYEDWILDTMKTPPPENSGERVMECPATEADTILHQLPLSDTSSKCDQNVVFGERCWSSSIAVNRVVGGEDAQPNQYPYQVALVIDTTHQCGGSIITSTWIMTAAHCVLNFDGSLIDNLSVRYNTVNNTHGDDVSIRRIIVHPQYFVDFTSLYQANDIALIEVCQAMDFNLPGVKPVCFVTDDSDLTVDLVIATGWGHLEEGGGRNPENLQQVKLSTVSPKECEEYYVQNSNMTVPPDNSTFVCAYTPNKDTCQGDSGGPIVAEVSPGCWIQVGIVSYGDGCARENLPGIYTRVSAFGDWIKEMIL